MTAPFKVINVIDNGKTVSEWITPLEKLLEKISSGADRLAKNYSLQNMNLQDHLSFDILVNEKNEIISFAGVYNGGRFPEGVYRVLNRTWVHEDYRVQHGAFAYLTSKYILPVQCERLRAKLKLVFVSRERLTGRRFLLKWASGILKNFFFCCVLIHHTPFLNLSFELLVQFHYDNLLLNGLE